MAALSQRPDLDLLDGPDLLWVEPIAHDALIEFYGVRVAGSGKAEDLARSHGHIWCAAASGQDVRRDLARFESLLAKSGLDVHDLADANASVARELLAFTAQRFRRSPRGFADASIELDALGQRISGALARSVA